MLRRRSRSRRRTAWCLVATLAALATPAPAGDRTVYEPGVDPAIGFNLVSWWNFGGSGATRWRDAVRNVHAAGFTEVSISPVRYANPSTGVIAASSQRGPELSHIAAGIAEAKGLGMTVTVNPFVEMENFAFWRGEYDPTPGSASWDAFWDGYTAYLGEVAAVAQANGADAMNIGTELKAITRNSGNNERWGEVIATVDAAFDGALGYAANWDNYRHGNLNNAIWSNPAIDYVGIDAYFRDTTTAAESDASGADPNEAFIAKVEAGWNTRLDDEILPYARSLRGGDGLPVVLTEVGYLPYNRTTVNPQNESGPLDSDEQVMAFKGLVRALDGRRDELSAIHVWQWGMDGSGGSKWNVAASPGGDQPNNLPLGEWLSSFVSAPALAGDFNSDGAVDAADYTVWRDNLGSETALPGDTTPGSVTAADYDVWRSNFGTSAADQNAANVAAPEPRAFLTIGLGAVLFSAARGCRA
ncbi:glycoside hydrolase TIM-barrel-like domain-containing protein [Botrimarina sp.]|uniref:glycoside hydrolase family 113 n=1 Tax=Botrimarina sp. TaxID=2795802 RepID=UPI0032EC0173